MTDLLNISNSKTGMKKELVSLNVSTSMGGGGVKQITRFPKYL